jgi:hypothetical protein
MTSIVLSEHLSPSERIAFADAMLHCAVRDLRAEMGLDADPDDDGVLAAQLVSSEMVQRVSRIEEDVDELRHEVRTGMETLREQLDRVTELVSIVARNTRATVLGRAGAGPPGIRASDLAGPSSSGPAAAETFDSSPESVARRERRIRRRMSEGMGKS